MTYSRLPVHWGFPGSSVGKESACNAGDPGSIPELGRSSGEGIGYPLQYSGLENSMDCIVHGVAKSQPRLSNFHFRESITQPQHLQGLLKFSLQLLFWFPLMHWEGGGGGRPSDDPRRTPISFQFCRVPNPTEIDGNLLWNNQVSCNKNKCSYFIFGQS